MTLFWYLVAAVAEIAGCYAFWAWLRKGASIWWIGPGVIALTVLALALTRIDAAHAGRAYAAYGGVYILSSLVWMGTVEGARPDRWDVIGVAVCLIGVGIILFGPRAA